jgi:hypothetical protein
MGKSFTLCRVSLKIVWVFGHFAGVISAFLNILYNLFCGAVLDITAPGVIQFGSVTGFYVLPALATLTLPIHLITDAVMLLAIPRYAVQ